MLQIKKQSKTKYTLIQHKNVALQSGALLAMLAVSAGGAYAQPVDRPEIQVPTTTVSAPLFIPVAYASMPRYKTDNVDLGPFGKQSILDTPASVTVIPEDLIVNQ